MREEVRHRITARQHASKQLGNSWPDGVSQHCGLVLGQAKLQSEEHKGVLHPHNAPQLPVTAAGLVL